MAVTNSVSTTVFNTRKVVDHAFRRCKLAPQQITAEYIQTAQDLLFLILSALVNKGRHLWCIQDVILPLYQGEKTVPCPVGTVDILSANLRSVQRLEGDATSSAGDAENSFDGDINTITTTLAAGNIQLEFDSTTPMTTFGILFGATATWDIAIQVSDDGVTWTTVYADAALEAVDSEWFWVDVEGIVPSQFCRLLANGATILVVREFVVSNTPQEIPLAKVNLDDYANLPNKFFLGRPTEYWYNKQREQPDMVVWPSPGPQFTFYQLTLKTMRYIMDVGTLRQEIEVPQRWYFAVVALLAYELAMEIPEVKADLIPFLSADARDKKNDAYAGETDSSPSTISPNLTPYTA